MLFVDIPNLTSLPNDAGIAAYTVSTAVATVEEVIAGPDTSITSASAANNLYKPSAKSK